MDRISVVHNQLSLVSYWLGYAGLTDDGRERLFALVRTLENLVAIEVMVRDELTETRQSVIGEYDDDPSSEQNDPSSEQNDPSSEQDGDSFKLTKKSETLLEIRRLMGTEKLARRTPKEPD